MDFSIPIKSEVLADLTKLKELMANCKTVEDARALENGYGLYIEIGDGNGGDHCILSKYDNLEPEEIEWFRVEEYGLLSYVYFRTDGSRTFFDIYNPGEDYAVLEDVTEDTIDQRYEYWLDLVKTEILR